MKNRWLCRLIGHRPDDGPVYYYPKRCPRCGADERFDSLRYPWHMRFALAGRWHALNAIQRARLRIAEWWRCPS